MGRQAKQLLTLPRSFRITLRQYNQIYAITLFICKQDSQESFNLTVAPELLSSHHLTPTSSVTSVLSDPTIKEETSGSLLSLKVMWISIQANEKYTESLVPI